MRTIAGQEDRAFLGTGINLGDPRQAAQGVATVASAVQGATAIARKRRPDMRPRDILGVAGSLALLGFGMWWKRKTLSDTAKARVARIYADASELFGFPRHWFPAIVWWETRGSFNPQSINMTGSDAKPGGSWGAAQISLQTAREAGFTGKPEELLDPVVNANWMGRILANPIDRHGAHRGAPKTLIEAATMWNSGTHPGDKDVPEVTSSEYVRGVTLASIDILDKGWA